VHFRRREGSAPLESGRSSVAGRWAPLLLAAAVVLPYAPLLDGRTLPVSDDVFVSDFLDAEIPSRVALGRQLAAGDTIAWLPGIGGGLPAAGGAHPVLLALYALLPPAPATTAWLLCALLLCAFGARALALRLGAAPLGALMAGAVFAHSGFVVCHVRHVSILLSVAPFPWALARLDRALTGLADGPRATVRRLAGFAALFGAVVLGGFPQIAYAAGLVFAAWTAVRAATQPLSTRVRLAMLGGVALAGAAAASMGAVQLLPLHELASTSDRAAGVSESFAVRFPFWPPDALSLLWPHPFGDISDATYRGEGIFWEDYGYAGVATALLAVLAAAAAVAGRRPGRGAVLLTAAAGAAAFVLVLGPATPVHAAVHRWIPGMDRFRLPTRFLFVTELALCVLAGAGLTIARERASRAASRLVRLLPAVVAAGTVLEVALANVPHNGFDPAAHWLAPPPAAALLPRTGEPYRVYAPAWKTVHRALFHRARGWNGDRAAWRRVRALLAPNANLLWGVETPDAYAGIAPRWVADLWGDHNREGLLNATLRLTERGVETTPEFFRLMVLGGVRYLATPLDVAGPVREVARADDMSLLELAPPLPRAFLVARASVADDAEALRRILDPAFDPAREVLLAPDLPMPPLAPDGAGAGSARIVFRAAGRTIIETDAPAPCWLVHGETWYPGWRAAIDGREVPLHRADVSWRALVIPGGRHTVELRLEPVALHRGAWISVLGAVALAAAWLLAGRRSRGGRAMHPAAGHDIASGSHATPPDPPL